MKHMCGVAVLMTAVGFALTGRGGTTSALPQGATADANPHKASSSSGDLLYVGAGVNRVFVLSYTRKASSLVACPFLQSRGDYAWTLTAMCS